MKTTDGPLTGIRILDMATVLAAPMSATLCADLGADVVKLELPDGSDMLRSLSPTKGEHGLHWKVTNRGKRGITLDVRKDEGRRIFLSLIQDFDVLVENFRVGTLERWGLDMETLHRVNPRLCVLRLTGFGQTGPYAARPGYARIFEAMSGFANLTGTPESPPQHMNYSLGDVVAGVFGAFSIASAMAERRLDVNLPGRVIDLSATEALLRLLDPLPVEFEQLGRIRKRSGSRATYTAPSNVYRSRDGQWITLVGTSQPIFRRLCEAMGKPDLLTDPRYSDSEVRLASSLCLDKVVEEWCASADLVVLAESLAKHGVPFSKVNDIADVIADPHFVAREAIIRLPDSELGSVPAPCTVPRFDGFSPPPPRSGPALGEHNAEIYGRLGITPKQLAQLQADGVV